MEDSLKDSINDLSFDLMHCDDINEVFKIASEIYRLTLEDHVEKAIKQLREANLVLNKVYEKDPFAREVQDDISEIMNTLRDRYFGEQEAFE